MFAMVLSGTSNFFTTGSDVLAAGLPLISHKIWAATMMIGGALALAAAWWPRDRLTGLLVERIALRAVGLSCPVYGIMVWSFSGNSGAIAASLTTSVGIASLWRAWHVTQELTNLRLFMARSYG